MTGQALITRINNTCERHNIEPTQIKVKIEDKEIFDIDLITEFEENTNTLILHRKNFLIK